ncbi:MAG TPA: carboxypeptidase-like regulatory domain-containing protein, partial [Thermoanaerobaculia bacterium]|nr:carboxypeptidase-like regulatory domain-containing protein [Thermoanaerobaculia bacterium]
ANGKFVQAAVPSAAVITVTGVLDTSVTVRQLSPDDLRARGINIDARNYDVYDYNFVFGINGQTVVVPYPVIIDRRTHETISAPAPTEYKLPAPTMTGPPPRFQPPVVIPMILDDDTGAGATPDAQGSGGEAQRRKRPSIPAAIVIPTGFGVLHQFFAVILNVSNSTPLGSQIQLDGIAATIATPSGLRVVKVNPAVTIGSAVPIRDASSGATFLVAQAQGSADWSLEALRAGTHTVDLDIRATYKSPNQADIPLHGHVASSIVVSDPRFQINFVHPDNIRAGESYTAYAFITNTSPQSQTVRVDLAAIPACGGGTANHLCRTSGAATIDQTFAPGQTVPIAYKLRSDINGHIFAAAGDAPDGITTAVTLQMGVSASGIPLSPATLVLPFYAQYVNTPLVDACMPLLGLGYSLASAPLTPSLASMPHVIRNDVFTRAQDIARAGQRIFVARQTLATDDAAEDRDPIFHLALDLLGNVERADRFDQTAELREWDQLRRMEATGRVAGAAMAQELARVGLANGKSMRDFVSDFAGATSHRSPYMLALVHGAAVTLNVSGATTRTSTSARTLAFADVNDFNAGQLAIVGRWNESLQLSITSASPSFSVELIYPGTNGGFLRTSFDVTNAAASTPVTLTVERGNRTLIVNGAAAVPVVNDVSPTPLSIVHGAQDLHLDPAGHIVTLLFNRPVNAGDAAMLRNRFSLTTNVAAANYSVTRKNDATTIVIPGAALQDDGRLLNISFDHALSRNAQYVIGVDAVDGMPATNLIPRVDNDAPGGIVAGKVIRGDGTLVGNTLVSLTSGTMQFDTTLPDGSFLFEFVARDIDRGLAGNYKLEVSDSDGKYASLDGVVRTPGAVQRVVLQFLGRGSVTGRVTYSDGVSLAGAVVTAGSTIYSELHRATTDANGVYTIADLPVGPITFAVNDPKGNVTYAANQIRTPGEVVTQDLVIQKRDLPGFGTVRVTVLRSD